MKKVCILGASSYVGARLYFDLKSKYSVIGTYGLNKLSDSFVHLDITNKEAIEKFLMEQKPEYIVHVANNPSNDWCLNNKEKAHELNVVSAHNIAFIANSINAKLIYISSVAAINVTNYYGETKKEAEDIIKKISDDYVILQPSLIIGFSPNTTNDRPFNRVLKNLDQKTSASYDNCWKFQPTWIGHISEVIEKIIEKNITKVSIPIVCKEFATRFDFAKCILSAFGIEVVAISKDAPSQDNDCSQTLGEMDLPTHSFKEVADKIIDEIKDREKFNI